MFVSALISLRDKYGLRGISPSQINNGYCADFAHVIWEQFRDAQVLSDEDFGQEYTHTFLYYGGRYYDAEAVFGVDRWEDLPIFVCT